MKTKKCILCETKKNFPDDFAQTENGGHKRICNTCLNAETKICRVCNQEKPVDEYWSVKHKRDGDKYPRNICKICATDVQRKFRIESKIKAIDYKGNICADCGVTYPQLPYAAWDFHHVNPNEKEFQWRTLKDKKWETIAKELDKCLLLCANCHRIRHCTDC